MNDNTMNDNICTLQKRNRGFTLIELLTVIAIIGILAAILIPVVGKVRESARAAVCVSNIRQISLAMLLYADGNNGVLPTSGGRDDPPLKSDWILWRNTWGFRIQDSEIIPYLGGLFSPDIYRCPSDKRILEGNPAYPYSYTLNRALGERTGRVGNYAQLDGRIDRLGEPARIIFLVEEAQPNDSTAWLWSTDDYLTVRHNGRGHVSFADAHVEAVYPEFVKYEGHWNPFPGPMFNYNGRR
jgi:prepilin-type N-terminal cleavage/methylation domain-containing protein/prepilin-type processing-associated H-X9-DG protein